MRAKNRASRAKNRDKRNEYYRNRYRSDPAFREAAKTRARAWERANPRARPYDEHERARKRAYYDANRERIKARVAAWSAANREKTRSYKAKWKSANRLRDLMNVHARNARKRQVTIVEFTVEQLEARLSMFPGCWMCGGPADQVEHVKPLAKGGLHVLANLRPACGPCNQRKGSKWPFPSQD